MLGYLFKFTQQDEISEGKHAKKEEKNEQCEQRKSFAQSRDLVLTNSSKLELACWHLL